jgi:hypothetical protein
MEHYIATSSAGVGGGLPPREFTPGGDFGWLKKSYRWSAGLASQEESRGERHGHNIVAMDFNFVADANIQVSPGGAYPASNLSCVSCHDPHGKYRRSADGAISTKGLPIIASGSYISSPEPGAQGTVGSYRLLGGKGYRPAPLLGGGEFTADPPAAVAPDSYNRGESAAESRVAYGKGMSEWCGNCHQAMHSDPNSGNSRHPSGNLARLNAEIITNYNSYVSSGNLNGDSNTAYTSMVPFEMGTDDYGILKRTANSNGSDRTGPSSNSNVMCLSCHRAHASGWDSMTRWNTNSTFMVYNGHYPGIDNGAPADIAQGRTSAEVQAAFYGRSADSYATYQRSLCNKCHAKD